MSTAVEMALAVALEQELITVVPGDDGEPVFVLTLKGEEYAAKAAKK